MRGPVASTMRLVPMRPRDPREPGRAASSLELFFDLVFVVAAAGAFSAGIEVEIDVLTGHSALTAPWASFTYTVPIAVFVGVIWLLAIRPHADRVVNAVVPVGAALVLIDPIIPVPIALTAVILAVVVAVLVWRAPTTPEPARSDLVG